MQAIRFARQAKYPALALAEASILLYLLTIPFGQTFPQVIRQSLLAFVIVSAVLLRFGPAHRSLGLPPFRLILPMLLFLGSVSLSVAYSVNPPLSLHYARFTPIAILFFLGLQQVVLSVESVYRFCIVIWCVIVMLSIDGLFQFGFGGSLLSGNELWGSRVTGSIPHPNDLALIPIFFPFLFILLKLTRRRILRWLIWCSVPLAIATVIVSQCRAALIGVVIGVMLWMWMTRRTRLAPIMFLLLGSILLLAWLFNLGDFQSRLGSIMSLHQEGRIGIWLVAWQMFLDFPLGGLGAHTFGEFYLYYLMEVPLPQGYIPEIAVIPWAHSIYLELLCERGLIGFGTFALIVGSLIHRLYVCLSINDNPEIRTIGAGLAGVLILFLLMGLIDLTFLKDWVSLLFWLFAALIARLPDLMGDTLTPSVESLPD